ncbi:MAG: MFS transporter [Proteobacteria bacterium]|nr:MFS transporter [Pseudomonadota bacterium]
MALADVRSEARWLSSGFLLTLCSSFGQTYFIALFAGHLKADLGLSDGLFGSLYTIGTLGSAAMLIWAGKLADRFPIRWLGIGVMVGLAVTALGMSAVESAWSLGLALFGLRFLGQGMMGHVAMTAMGRWFNRKRGRAVAIAGLGFPVGEAVLPLIVVASIGLIGWRMTWVAAAVLLATVPVLVMFFLLKRERVPTTGPAAHDGTGPRTSRRHWTRGEVLRSPLFYALMPGLLGPPFIQTGMFFNQIEIVEWRGWDLTACFPILAAANVLTSLGIGWLVDRVGARRLLPLVQIPLGLATVLLVLVPSPYVLPVFMILIGMSHGSISTVQSALWAEIYGTDHLGAIRGMGMAAMVFATALSPGLMGVLMDGGIALQNQLAVMAVYCAAAALWMAAMVPRLNRQLEA